MAVTSMIVPLENAPISVNLMVYGKSGVGKTVFAGSADKVLFIAPEDDGTISAAVQGSKADKWPVKTWKDVQLAFRWLRENMEEAQGKYDWVAIDSITRMQKLLKQDILDDAVAENSDRDPDIPQIQDYQKWQNKFERFVLGFNALPLNIVWTALVRAEEDEEGNDFLTADITGKGYQLAQTVASHMTSYGCMQAKEINVKDDEGNTKKDEKTGKNVTKIVRFITWQDTGVVQGKDRTGVLAPRTVNKTLQEVNDMIFAK